MKLSESDIINWWLDKFFNTNLDQVIKDNPQWQDNPDKHSIEFYKKYAVSQEQMDEFDNYFHKDIPKILGISRKLWNKVGYLTYLNVAPSLKN